MRVLVMGAVAALVAVPAMAQVRTGYTAIAAGSLGDAERTLTRERAIYPQRPELMLNLAAVYARTDRAMQARALYADVLNGEPVAMEMRDGSVESSHLLARRGLAQLDMTIAAR